MQDFNIQHLNATLLIFVQQDCTARGPGRENISFALGLIFQLFPWDCNNSFPGTNKKAIFKCKTFSNLKQVSVFVEKKIGHSKIKPFEEFNYSKIVAYLCWEHF